MSTPTNKPTPLDVKAAVELCVGTLWECFANQDTMEAKLAMRKHVRELYKLLGDPTRDDFPDIFDTSCVYGFEPRPGYTKNIYHIHSVYSACFNQSPIDYKIKQPSKTKQRIINRYDKAGWDITVIAYNVLCTKIVQHPRFPQVAVWFYVSRDSARYEYMLIKDQYDNTH